MTRQARINYERFDYRWSVLPIRFWLHPFRYHWHWFRLSQWHLTRFRSNDGRRYGTFQLNLGPVTLTRSFSVEFDAQD